MVLAIFTILQRVVAFEKISPYFSRLITFMKPKQVHFIMGCRFVSGCSPPHLAVTQLPLTYGASTLAPFADFHHNVLMLSQSHIGVGTVDFSTAPPSEPCVRISRTRLSSWCYSFEALFFSSTHLLDSVCSWFLSFFTMPALRWVLSILNIHLFFLRLVRLFFVRIDLSQ